MPHALSSMPHAPSSMPNAADPRELLRQWASGPAPAGPAPAGPAPTAPAPAPAPGCAAPRVEAWLLLGRLLQRAGHGGPATCHVAAAARVLLTRLASDERPAAQQFAHQQEQRGVQAGTGAGATGDEAGRGPRGGEAEEAWSPSPERLLDLLAWCCCVAGDVLMVAQEQGRKAGAGMGAGGGTRSTGRKVGNGTSAGGGGLQGEAAGGGGGAVGCSGLHDPAAALRCYRGALRLCPGNGAYEGRVR